MTNLKRRSFLKAAAKTAGVMIVSPSVLGGPKYTAPSDRLNIACVGNGTQGTRVMLDLLKIPDLVITSVADPVKEDTKYLNWGPHELRDGIRRAIEEPNWDAQALDTECRAGREPAKRIVEAWYGKQKAKTYKGCNAYADFRELLEKESGIDGVVVGAPDHQHAYISIKSLEKGKHVYCQKPMTNTVYEARLMADTARRIRKATQVATVNASDEDTDLLCELIWSGAIGPIREVHNWSHRPVWPQGMHTLPAPEAVPAGFDWDLWQGPSQPKPFSYQYTHTVFRGWWEYGTGAIGDMGCYSFDVIFRALKLGYPVSIEANGSTFFDFPGTRGTQYFPGESHPRSMVAHFNFAERNGMPGVDLFWYDGGMRPPKPKELDADGIEMPAEGTLYVGDFGKILTGLVGEEPRLIPAARHKAATIPPKTIERSKGHYLDWVAAARGGKPARSTFEFAGPVTEALCLANIAMRTRKKLWYDAAAMKTQDEAANQLLKRNYRPGWEL